MNVLYHPPWGDGDYQKPLYDSLSEHNVTAIETRNHPVIPILNSRSLLEQADIFHIHWIHTLYGGGSKWMPIIILLLIPQMLYLKLSQTPIVWTIHNLKTHDTPYPHLDRFIRIIFARLVCSDLIVHCYSAKKVVTKEYRLPKTIEDDIHIIPHGNYEMYPNDRSGDSPINVYTPSEGICYLHFGSIKPYKGTVELAETFLEVARDEDRLIVAGRQSDEDYTKELKSIVSDDPRITLRLGYVENRAFQYYADAADIVALPYQNVFTSGVAHLSLSFGLPVLGPKMGCLPETVPDQAGILYDSDGLKDSLIEARSFDYDTASVTAKDIMSKKDWEFIALETFCIYQRLLKDVKNQD